MYYYVLKDDGTVANSIVLAEDADPAAFGAVADERVLRIGDAWTPPPTETERLRQQVADLQNQILLMRLGG